MFELLADRKAFLEVLRNLEPAAKRKIKVILKVLKSNPVPAKVFDVRKIAGRENTYRMRVGKYRIIYKVEWKERKVLLLKLEKRAKAYRNI